MSAMRVSLILSLLFSSLFSDDEIAKTEPFALNIEAPAPEPSPLETKELIAKNNKILMDIASGKTKDPADGYTINYDTVSIIE
jgi:hypothetical protein